MMGFFMLYLKLIFRFFIVGYLRFLRTFDMGFMHTFISGLTLLRF